MGNDGATDEANKSESEQQQANAADGEAGQSSDAAAGDASGSAVNIQDKQRKMSSGLDALDSLLAKTDNAQQSMARQNKQMKSFLP